MQQYHDSNKLVMNEDKTIMSINTRNKEHKKITITTDTKQIEHKPVYMLLGIIHNDKLNFNDHLVNGFKDKRGLITRLKQRVGLIKKNEIQ